MQVYLDNSATTKVFDSVKDICVKVMTEDYGNPSSLHYKGVESEKYLKEARDIISKSLRAKTQEIIFTSGGTESNNLAIIGTALANKRAGNHIITSTIEHPSVYNVFGFLEEQGFRVSYVPVDNNGHLRQDILEQTIDDETILVSCMYVNNEIGSVNPIAEIGALIKSKNPKIVFHVDAIQAYGKYKIVPKNINVDLLSVSSHKIHGPKGVGFIYIKEGTKIRPVMFGGGQQKGMRSGTDNVPGVAGMAEAVHKIYENHDEKIEKMYALKGHFIDRLSELSDVYVNGLIGKDSAPHVISVSFGGVRSEVLLHALEDKGICVSSGSACSSNHPAVSGTLKGIGVKRELLDSTLRFSLSVFTTKEELDYTIDTLKELLPFYRRYTRH